MTQSTDRSLTRSPIACGKLLAAASLLALTAALAPASAAPAAQPAAPAAEPTIQSDCYIFEDDSYQCGAYYIEHIPSIDADGNHVTVEAWTFLPGQSVITGCLPSAVYGRPSGCGAPYIRVVTIPAAD